MMAIRTFQQIFIQSCKLYKQSFSSVAPYGIALAVSVCTYIYFNWGISSKGVPSLADVSLSLLFAVLNWLFILALCLSLNHCYHGQCRFQWQTFKQACGRLPRIFFGVLLVSLCISAFTMALTILAWYLIEFALDHLVVTKGLESWVFFKALTLLEFFDALKSLGFFGHQVLLFIFEAVRHPIMLLTLLFFSPWLKMYFFILLLDKECGFFSTFPAAWRLVRGNYWNTFFMILCTGFLWGIGMCVLYLLVGPALAAVGRMAAVGPGMLKNIAGVVKVFTTTLILPIAIGVFLIQYHRLRERRRNCKRL